MPAADRCVDDLQSQNSLLCSRAFLAREAFIQQRLKGRVEADLHQRVGRVVGARRLAFVAGRHVEDKPLVDTGCCRVNFRMEFQQLLVDAPQFFAAQIAVVDRAASVVVCDVRQASHRRQQSLIGNRGNAQHSNGGLRPEIATQRRDAQLRTALRPAQALHDELERFIEIPVTVAPYRAGQLLEPDCRIVFFIEVFGPLGGSRIQQQVAAFGDKQK